MHSKGKALGTLTVGSSSPDAFAGCGSMLKPSHEAPERTELDFTNLEGQYKISHLPELDNLTPVI